MMGLTFGENLWEQVFPEPLSKLFLQNSSRNSDLNSWNFGWEYVSHCLERILLILRDREVGVLGEEILRLPLDYGKEERGFWGRDSSRPQTLVPVHISVCQPPHDPLGGGGRRNLKLGEGAEPPPAVRFGNRFPPNPLLNSFCRIPYGILILTDGTTDGNT